MEMQITMRTIEIFGKAYWEPAGVAKLDEFRSQIESGWRGTLQEFLRGYAFERAGASPHYAPNAVKAVAEYKGDFDAREFEVFVWEIFKSLIGSEDGKGTNHRNNPLVIAKPPEKSIATFLSETIGSTNPNIGRWAIELMNSGHVNEAHKKLTEISGIGPKIASFFLRDVAYVFDLKDQNIRFSESLQPIDRWTHWGAEALVSYAGMTEAISIAQCQRVIIEASRQSNTDPLLINTGLWFIGSNFAESNIDFQTALKDFGALHSLLDAAKSRLHREEQILKARCELLDEAMEGITADMDASL